MHIISKKKIRDCINKNSQAELPLVEWYIKMRDSAAASMTELRATFNSVDFVEGYMIFNIDGNNYRLITAIHFNTQLCYIREIWTHAEYSKPYNQAKLQRGKL